MMRRTHVITGLFAALAMGVGACSSDSSGGVQIVPATDVEDNGGNGDKDIAPTVDATPGPSAIAPGVYQLSHNQGPVTGGTILGIAGAGFAEGLHVRFGSAEADVLKLADAGHVVVRTPPGTAGATDVVIENADGGVGTLPNAFTYYEANSETHPGPDLLEAIPATGPTVGGTVALIRGNNFQVGCTFYIAWGPVTKSDLTNATSATIVTPPMDPGSAVLAVTNPDGQSAELVHGFTAYVAGDGTVETTPAPQIDSVAPQAGSIEGGLLVTVKGSNFREGSQLIIGGKLAQTWTLISDTEGTFEAPPHEEGLVDVAVTDGLGQSAIRKNAFLYFVNPPVIYSVTPSSGPKNGGTVVTLNGKHFVQGMTVLVGGKPCTGVTVGAGDGASTTSDFATCTIPPGDEAGPVMVQATNPDGLAGQLPGGYTYLNPNPKVTSITPASGPLEGGDVAVIVGEDFLPGSQVRFGTTPAAVIYQTSPKAITVEIPAATVGGSVDVVVTAEGWPDAALTDGYTYVAPSNPVLTSVAPGHGPTEGGTAVAIHGTDLRATSVVYFGGVQAGSVAYAGPEGIGVVAPPHAAGSVDVVVKTPGFPDSTLAAAFTYDPPPVPALASVSPAVGPVAGGVTIIASGSSFRADSVVWFGSSPAATTVLGPTALSAVLPSHADGLVDVVVKTPGFPDSTLVAGFRYEAPGAPVLLAVAPPSGPMAGGTSVAVTGKNFAADSTVWFGGTPANGTQYAGPNGLGVVAPAHAPGKVDVVVKTAGFPDTTLAQAFTYEAPGNPTISMVAPTNGPTDGGIIVAVVGQNLRPDSVVWFGSTPSAAAYYSGAEGLGVLLPAHAAGAVDVVVKTPGVPDAILKGGFTFVEPGPPQITAVAPSQGSAEGGIVVAVVGENLRPESRVLFGTTQAAISYYSGETGLGVVLPAHAAGAVDVIVRTTGFPDAVLTGGFTYVQPGPPTATGLVPAKGSTAGGTAVVIQGNDFRTNCGVWFGATPASVVFNGPTGIGVLAPPAAGGAEGAASITVKCPGFPDVAVPGTFTYELPQVVTAGSTPAIAQIQPATGPTTGGGWVIIKGFDFPSKAAVRFGTTSALDVIVISSDTLTARVPSGAVGAVDVTVRDVASGVEAKLPSGYVYFDAATAGPGPTLTFIKPAIGPVAGGTLAWLGGTGFGPGALVFIDGRPAGSVKVASDTTASAFTPAGDLGPADVTIVNQNGQFATANAAFVYTVSAGKVTLSQAYPSQGSVAGGTKVTVAGSGFSPGLLAFVDGVPVATVLKGPGAVEITTPAHPPGLADIHVTAPDGATAALPGAFNFILQAPFVAAVSPSYGKPSGGTQVIISGQGFHVNATVTFGGKPAQVLLAADGLITAIAPSGAVGVVDVTVTNPDFLSSTLTKAFTYTDGVPGNVVRVHQVEPPVGPKSGGTAVTIHGAGFEAGVAVLFGTGVASDVQILSPTTILAVVPAGATGPVDVQVVVPEIGTGLLSAGFFYYDPAIAGDFPVIGSLTPSIGPSAGGTIARLDVVPAPVGAKVYVDGALATVLGGDGQTYFAIAMPAHTAGSVSVAVMLAGGKADVLTDAFTYYTPGGGLQLPTLAGVAPLDGSSLGGQAITYTGTKFGGAPIAFLGYRSLAITAHSDTTLGGITPPHPAGLADAVVTRADGFSVVLKSAYGFTAPGPVPETVFPQIGRIDGGLVVAVSGQGFVAGAKVFLGAIESPSVVVAADNVLTFVTPAVGSPGPRDLKVVNPDGKQGTLASAFTYNDNVFDEPAPHVIAVVPNHGPFQGGTVAAVYGTDFQQGAQILFGGKPAKIHLIDNNLATVTAPPGYIGSVDVTVLNPDGQSASLPAGFSYISTSLPAPNVLGITPKSGPESGGTAVIFTGAKFTGGGIGFVGYRPVSSWTVLNSAIATGTTVPGTPGNTDIVVTNGDGQSSTLLGAWDYVGAPHIDSFDPTVGAVAGGKVVLLAGKNFSYQAKVEIGGKPAASIDVLSPLAIRIMTPANDPGPAQVKVTNPDGQFHVAADPYLYVLPPSLTQVFPAKGSAAGGSPVVLKGDHFLAGATVQFGNKLATGVTLVNATTLVLVAPSGTVGSTVNVTVTNPDGQAAIKYTAYGYVDPATIGPAPTLSALKPPTGPTSGGTWGLLTGANVQSGAWAVFGTVPVDQFDVKSATSARFVTAPSIAGLVSVTLLNPDGGFGVTPDAFTYVDDAALDAPAVVTGLTPTSGPTKGGTPVVFSGTDLDADAVVFFDTTAAAGVTALSPTITATTPAHPTGTVDVVLTDAEGQTTVIIAGFRFVPPPTLESIAPTSGPSSGGTFVTATGSGFVIGATPAASTRVRLCEDYATSTGCVDVDVVKTTIVSGTQLTFNTPAQIAGTSDVVVINPDGQEAVLAHAFFFRPPPKILGVNPQSGSTLGGEVVTISGTDFQLGAEVTFSNVKATSVNVQSSNTIVCTTPAGAPGPAVVTVKNPDLSTHSLGGGFLYIKPPTVLAAFPTLGPETGGTVVTIQGDGYVAGSKVYFGTKLVPAIDVQIDSMNVIKARTPSGVGPVAIKVVNPDGQVGILGGGFIYVPVIAAPQVTAVTPAYGATGGGYILQVTGNNFLDGAQVSFGSDAVGWANGYNAVVKNAGTLIIVTAPAHPAGQVDVRVSNSDGQSGTAKNGFEFVEPLGLPGLAYAGIVPQRGPAAGGYQVTVYGQGFKQGIRVFFGKNATATWTEAPFVMRLGPTILRVTVPASATNAKVDVRLSNPVVMGAADEVVAALAFTYGQSVVLVPKGQRLPLDTVWDDREALLFDANGDGLDDIFVTHRDYNQELFINTHDVNGIPGQLIDQSATNLPAHPQLFNPFHPRAIDADKDGDLDILVAYGWSTATSLGLYRNAGDGTFTFEDKADHGLNNPYDIDIADLNCDGLEDVLIVGDGPDVIMVGDAKGNWRVANSGIAGTPVLPNQNEPTRGAAIADVDHDGDNDIVTANDSAYQNRLYYNNCNNTALAPTCTFDIAGCVMKTFGGHRYAFCNSEAPNWFDAETKCETYGYQLATINDLPEQQFMRTNTTFDTWFGYQEKTTEHNYVWPFGVSSYTKWCAGQPNDTGVDDCVRITTAVDGCWDDVGCTAGQRFICEAPVTVTCPLAWQFTDATYGAGKNFPVSGANTRDVALTDVNGDGWADVVLVAFGQSTRIYINSSGNFVNDAGQRFPQTETLTQATRVIATDVDMDNDVDLIITKYQTTGRNWPWVYLNDKSQGGIGAFTDATPTNMPPYRGEDSNEIAVGDLNEDSLPDIFVMNEDHQDWLLQNHGYAENKSMTEANRVPIGSFANNTQLGIPEQTADAYASAVGDIDGDSDLDIVLCYTDSTLRPGVWVNDGAGNFFELNSERMPAGVNCGCNPGNIDLVDVDKDNDLDVMMACYTGGIRQLANDGTGHFMNTSADNIPSYAAEANTAQAFGDIDGDGDLDWLVGSWSYAQWRTFLNGGPVYGAGKGAYWVQRNDLLDTSTTTTCGNCQSEKAILIADLNNDTFPDVYIGSPGGQNWLWHNSNGKGKMTHVTSSHLPSVSAYTNYVLASDVDFDGDVDLFAAIDGQSRLFVGELDYKYADATASNLPGGMNANNTGAEVVDLDLDGFPDFFTTSYEAQNQVILNKGGSVFENFTSDLPKDKDPSRSVHKGDFDGDGVLDLFISNRQANRIYLNKTPHP